MNSVIVGVELVYSLMKDRGTRNLANKVIHPPSDIPSDDCSVIVENLVGPINPLFLTPIIDCHADYVSPSGSAVIPKHYGYQGRILQIR
jgi:hypothetical protein